MSEIRPLFADFPQTLPCLTLWPEWAYAVKYYGKPVENRSWPFPKHLAGGWLGIHAGKKIGGAVMNERDGIECMLMTAQHAGYHFADKKGLIRKVMDLVKAESSRLVAAVRLSSAKPPEFRDGVMRGWRDLSQWGWEFAEVSSLKEPMPMGGKQGIFCLTPEMTARVLASLSPPERRIHP